MTIFQYRSVTLSEGKSHSTHHFCWLNPIKPPFSYCFPMVFLWCFQPDIFPPIPVLHRRRTTGVDEADGGGGTWCRTGHVDMEKNIPSHIHIHRDWHIQTCILHIHIHIHIQIQIHVQIQIHLHRHIHIHIHYTLYIIHYTLYIIHYILYIIHYT